MPRGDGAVCCLIPPAGGGLGQQCPAEAGKHHHFHSKTRVSNFQIHGLKSKFKILVKTCTLLYFYV